MTQERNRILGLLAAGKINEEEAARLLDALDARSAPPAGPPASASTAGQAGTPDQAAPPPPATPYPLTLTVDYPDRPLDRLSSALRFLWIIPIGVIAALIGSGTMSGGHRLFLVVGGGRHPLRARAPHAPLPAEVPALVVRLEPRPHPLPRPGRVRTPCCCATSTPPPTRSRPSIWTSPTRTRQQLNRGLPLVKWFLAIPHYFVLCFLWIGVVVCVIIAWFAILFTGRYPRACSTTWWE